MSLSFVEEYGRNALTSGDGDDPEDGADELLASTIGGPSYMDDHLQMRRYNVFGSGDAVRRFNTLTDAQYNVVALQDDLTSTIVERIGVSLPISTVQHC